MLFPPYQSLVETVAAGAGVGAADQSVVFVVVVVAAKFDPWEGAAQEEGFEVVVPAVVAAEGAGAAQESQSLLPVLAALVDEDEEEGA